MSSIAHSRCRTIDKDCLCKAAKDLGVKMSEKESELSVGATRFKFDSKGNVEVSYWDDVKSATKQARNLAQLSTYYTMAKRLEKSGLKMTRSVKDVILAVKSNQDLTMEFEQVDSQEKVAVGS